MIVRPPERHSKTQQPHLFSIMLGHIYGLALSACLLSISPVTVLAALPTTEELASLPRYRLKHRRTLDGRLCAAAFVQNGSVYTGCADVANPVGASGRLWCYVEPQLSGEQGSWGFCAPDIDYELVRKQVKNEMPDKVKAVRQYISHLDKAEVAAKDTLKLLHAHCV